MPSGRGDWGEVALGEAACLNLVVRAPDLKDEIPDSIPALTTCWVCSFISSHVADWSAIPAPVVTLPTSFICNSFLLLYMVLSISTAERNT